VKLKNEQMDFTKTCKGFMTLISTYLFNRHQSENTLIKSNFKYTFYLLTLAKGFYLLIFNHSYLDTQYWASLAQRLETDGNC